VDPLQRVELRMETIAAEAAIESGMRFAWSTGSELCLAASPLFLARSSGTTSPKRGAAAVGQLAFFTPGRLRGLVPSFPFGLTPVRVRTPSASRRSGSPLPSVTVAIALRR